MQRSIIWYKNLPTGFYPEPAEPDSFHTTHLKKDQIYCMLPSTSRFSKEYFPFMFHDQIFVNISDLTGHGNMTGSTGYVKRLLA
jgi:hypothetical protein